MSDHQYLVERIGEVLDVSRERTIKVLEFSTKHIIRLWLSVLVLFALNIITLLIVLEVINL